MVQQNYFQICIQQNSRSPSAKSFFSRRDVIALLSEYQKYSISWFVLSLSSWKKEETLKNSNVKW